MQRLWSCPNPDCDEPAVRAPSKPRRDDIRRYCLKCSVKTGRLVPRVCLALEKEREEKAAKAKEKASEATERRRIQREKDKAAKLANETVSGVDLRGLMPKFWDALQKAAKQLNISTYSTMPVLRIVSARRPGSSGKGSPWKGVKLSVDRNEDPVKLEELLLHEMCHALLGPKNGEWHQPEFCKVLMGAAKILWNVEVAYIIGAGRVYILDDLIMKEMWKARGLPEGKTHWIERHQKLKEARAVKSPDPNKNKGIDQAA